jgi:hypothetical protein
LGISCWRWWPTDGAPIEDATIDRLFCIPAQASIELSLTPPAQSLDTAETAALKRRLDEAEQMNAKFLAEETDKLDAYAEDLEKAADAEIKMRDDEIKGKRKVIVPPPCPSPKKLNCSGRSRSSKASATTGRWPNSKRKKAIRREVEDILDSVQTSLALTPVLTPVFTIRWELRG